MTIFLEIMQNFLGPRIAKIASGGAAADESYGNALASWLGGGRKPDLSQFKQEQTNKLKETIHHFQDKFQGCGLRMMDETCGFCRPNKEYTVGELRELGIGNQSWYFLHTDEKKKEQKLLYYDVSKQSIEPVRCNPAKLRMLDEYFTRIQNKTKVKIPTVQELSAKELTQITSITGHRQLSDEELIRYKRAQYIVTNKRVIYFNPVSTPPLQYLPCAPEDLKFLRNFFLAEEETASSSSTKGSVYEKFQVPMSSRQLVELLSPQQLGVIMQITRHSEVTNYCDTPNYISDQTTKAMMQYAIQSYIHVVNVASDDAQCGRGNVAGREELLKILDASFDELREEGLLNLPNNEDPLNIFYFYMALYFAHKACARKGLLTWIIDSPAVFNGVQVTQEKEDLIRKYLVKIKNRLQEIDENKDTYTQLRIAAVLDELEKMIPEHLDILKKHKRGVDVPLTIGIPIISVKGRVPTYQPSPGHLGSYIESVKQALARLNESLEEAAQAKSDFSSIPFSSSPSYSSSLSTQTTPYSGAHPVLPQKSSMCSTSSNSVAPSNLFSSTSSSHRLPQHPSFPPSSSTPLAAPPLSSLSGKSHSSMEVPTQSKATPTNSSSAGLAFQQPNLIGQSPSSTGPFDFLSGNQAEFTPQTFNPEAMMATPGSRPGQSPLTPSPLEHHGLFSQGSASSLPTLAPLPLAAEAYQSAESANALPLPFNFFNGSAGFAEATPLAALSLEDQQKLEEEQRHTEGMNL